jgi:formylglycine-generating enzyme required for sulfatase activity
MPDPITITLQIGARDAQRNAYPVQLLHEGKPLADIWTDINRQTLLEHEHRFNAHDYGMKLYDAIFNGKVGDIYQRLIGKAGAETTVRVQLVIHPDAPELHALPWERLFHRFGDGETPLAASARTPFSRFLVSGAGDQPPVRESPLRLLVAIANPAGLPDGCSPVDLAGEATSLADLIAGLSGRVQGSLLPGRSGLPDDLRRHLTGQGWTIYDGDGVTSWQAIQRLLPGHHVLHILAHGQFKPGEAPGKGTAYLLLEHEGSIKVARGALDRVVDDDIVEGLAGVYPLPQLVFLAACNSAKRPSAGAEATTGANPFVGLAPKLVSAGVPAIVAMQDEVPMDLARTLAVDFYRRLFDHGSVDGALNEARSLILKSNQFEWAIPVLFMRLKNGQLFSLKRSEPRKAFEPELVFVGGGKFLMGSDPVPGVSDSETPQHPVLLAPYYIGKYPVTNLEYAEFVKRVKTQDVPSQSGWFNRKPTKRLDHPVTGVSWHDALAYCAWLSKETGRRYRLPTEAEWEKAARGTDRRRYPWGEAWDDRCANVGRQETTPVGQHPLGASPFGCQDMLGNVEEWTRTLWGTQFASPEYRYPHPFDENDGRDLSTADDLPVQGKVVHRGGSFRSKAAELYCALRDCADPSSKIAWRGFRVVMEV